MMDFWSLLNLHPEASLDGWSLFFWLAVIGFFVGVLSGLFGAGGGFLITPVLSNLLDVPYALSVGSGLCFIIGTTMTGALRHRRMGNIEPKTIFLIASGSVIGTFCGHEIQGWLRNVLAGGEEPIFRNYMNGLYLPLLLGTAWMVWRGRAEEHEGKSMLQKFRLGPRVDLKAAGLSGVSLPGLMGVGFGVGVLTGLLGVGGGVLFMPILLLVVGLHMHQAVGTSLGVVLISAMVGTILAGWAGDVSLTIAASLMVTSTLGVQIGAWLCNRLHANKLRRYFSFVVLATAAMVLYKLVAPLFES